MSLKEKRMESLTVEIAEHIARVTLRGPGRGNAMGPAFWREVPEVMAQLDADPEVRVVVIRGAGSHFSYGLDLKAMLGELGPHLQGARTAGHRTDLLAIIERMQGTMTSLARCRKPVIASIHGWCIGGAVDLITAADIRVCSREAMFSVREVRIGMVADVGTLQRLPRIVGHGHARELALTGRDFDAAHAEHIGLVTAVYDDQEALEAATDELAATLAQNPPLAVQGTKRVIDWSADHSTADGLSYVAAWNAAFLQSEDLAEAFTAFLEKRDPVFRGR